MSAANKLDKQIIEYLSRLNDKQKKAVLTLVKAFAEGQESKIRSNSAFITELDRKYAEYENGKRSWFTLDEPKTRVRKHIKSKGRSKR
jgi:hypothetical protein